MPRLSIRHATRYAYREPVGLGEHRVMLRPIEAPDQHLVAHRLDISPAPVSLVHTRDVFGNRVDVADFAADVRARELAVIAESTVEQPMAAPFAGAEGGVGPHGDFAYAPDAAPQIAPFVRRAADPDIAVWAGRFLNPRGATPLEELLAAMARAIRGDFTYAKRLYGPAQDPARTLARRDGTCRDFAVLMIEAARSLGLAAQFASGYILAPAKPGQTERRGGGHTHAWCRVYLPGAGWTDFDPTNGLIGGAGLVRVAVSARADQVGALSGAWCGDSGDYLGMEVEVEVTQETAALEEAA